LAGRFGLNLGAWCEVTDVSMDRIRPNVPMFQKVRYLIHSVELIETKKPAFKKKDELNINHLHLTIGELNINYISVINCILAMV